MTLSQMQYFEAVYRLGSFTKAAQELFVSQPAISQGIHELEEECGIPLIQRQGKKLIITPEGQTLAEEVGLIIKQINGLQNKIDNAGLSRNYVRVGLSTFSGNTVFPHIVRSFAQKFPDIKLEVQENGTAELFELLKANRVDVIITSPGKAFEDTYNDRAQFHILPIKKGGIGYFVHKDHPFAARESITIEEIATQPLILLDEKFGVARRVKRTFESKKLPINVLLTTMQMYTIERFVEKNAATGFLPVEIRNYNNSIRYIPCEDFPAKGEVALLWKANGELYPAVSKFIDCSKEIAEKIKSGSL